MNIADLLRQLVVYSVAAALTHDSHADEMVEQIKDRIVKKSQSDTQRVEKARFLLARLTETPDVFTTGEYRAQAMAAKRLLFEALSEE